MGLLRHARLRRGWLGRGRRMSPGLMNALLLNTGLLHALPLQILLWPIWWRRTLLPNALLLA